MTRPMTPDPDLLSDVCAASAAYLCNMWQQLAELPPTERFKRLQTFCEATIAAYRDGLSGWVARPSLN